MDIASSVTIAGSQATIGRLGMPQCASIVSKSAQVLCGEDNKDGELARGIDQVISMRSSSKLMSAGYT